MLQESDIIPYHLSRPLGERALILAPHPDDETFGCGGAIRLLVEAKKYVKIIFLTSGDRADPSNPESYQPTRPPLPSRETTLPPPAEDECKGEFQEERQVTTYSLLREKEAQKALRILGVSDYEFLRFPDRGIYTSYKKVLHRLQGIIEEFRPDTLYCPSMVELNPDHRATAALSMEVQKVGLEESRNMSALRIAFYEVTTPLRPNVLVDITPAYRKKRKAMKCYGSQLKLKDYMGHVAALNTVRRLTVEGPRYVEAFWLVQRPLKAEDITKWLSFELAEP